MTDPRRTIALCLAVTLPAALPVATWAQTAPNPAGSGAMMSAEGIDVVATDGTRIGEVEEVLVDATGQPVAMVVEFATGFLGLNDPEVVVPLEALSFDNGRYVSSLSKDELSNLQQWDD